MVTNLTPRFQDYSNASMNRRKTHLYMIQNLGCQLSLHSIRSLVKPVAHHVFPAQLPKTFRDLDDWTFIPYVVG
jgi:hypothetical protein